MIQTIICCRICNQNIFQSLRQVRFHVRKLHVLQIFLFASSGDTSVIYTPESRPKYCSFIVMCTVGISNPTSTDPRWIFIGWMSPDVNLFPLQWHHNERDFVSNHQRLDCKLNGLFRCRSKKNIKAPCHWPLSGLPVNSLHKGPVTRKMFPFDDVIMQDKNTTCWVFCCGRP